MASFHEFAPLYTGDDYNGWIAFFRLERLQDILKGEIGIENLKDVLEASRDPGCMEIISRAAPPLIFRRFKDAIAKTKIFRGTVQLYHRDVEYFDINACREQCGI